MTVKRGHCLNECASCFNTDATGKGCAAFSEPLTIWPKCPAWSPDRNFYPDLRKWSKRTKRNSKTGRQDEYARLYQEEGWTQELILAVKGG